MSFDIVVCVGHHDEDIIEKVLVYTKKNILDHRNIYLVCANKFLEIEGAITIDERIFPFTIEDVQSIQGTRDRNGWYLQQLLKMYSGLIIPGILEKYLIIDCDTYFLKPTKFLTEDNKCIFTTGTEYHTPYFEHMNRLHPSLKKVHPLSGISHHTFFDTVLVKEMIKLIEDYHNNLKPFWKIFLDEIDPAHYERSGSAENELYFTYVYIYHPSRMEIRQLHWGNSSTLDLNSNCDFLSVHWYIRK
jgi:hypothetical protein